MKKEDPIITPESVKKYIKEHQIENIKLAVVDVDGVLRGKYVNSKKFLSALDKGFGFCSVIFGWDSNDVLYKNDSFTGWADGFTDANATIDASSMRVLPTEDYKSVIFLVDFSESNASSVCPRSVLRKTLDRLGNIGYTASASFEFEFFLFNETPKSIRDKNYHNLEPMTPGNFGYSILRSSTHANFYHEIMSLAQEMGMPLEGLHTETGAGVLEGALEYSEALRAADNGALFKNFVKVWAQQNSLMASFMAKWSSSYPGQSGHIHISLQNKDGSSAFYDKSKEHGMSDVMRWFIGGQQKLMPELLAMVASTCNSYTRLIPGFWAPTAASWGMDNRTCALRAIPGSEKSQRVEYRVSAADINPYLALAAAIGSGIWGIENKIEPTKAVDGNAYDVDFPQELQLPRTLSHAAEKFKNSKIARDLFGDIFVDHYAYTRLWEDQQQLGAITDWQLKRYFEII
ncbi:glutamine synthetase [Arenibacter sp. N53]|uniref:glutamine synthetase family protein n=1 Tax=Arenibacter TaxID=178469 RepID=UPI000CD47CEC|nr:MULTISPECIES: glutamine synthetase family protein [Arenibacter]MCM4152701.1 glutamine synthetase [Arenibacter sp. N53]